MKAGSLPSPVTHPKGTLVFQGLFNLFSCLFTSPTHHTSYQVTPDSLGFPKVVLFESYPSSLGPDYSLVSGIHLPAVNTSDLLAVPPQALASADSQVPMNNLCTHCI